MSTPARVERVGQQIQAALAEVFSRGKLRDPRIGYITITGVKVSSDLRVAKVFYSILGDEQARAETQKGLDAAKGFLRREVTSQLGLKFSPEIFFAYDASVAEGDKIDRLIREVREREGW
jgi:ribosome-binding factor A